jgi:hypothetical protein
VRIGANVIQTDPLLDARYRARTGSPLIGKGDPDVGAPAGSPSQIGPHTYD